MRFSLFLNLKSLNINIMLLVMYKIIKKGNLISEYKGIYYSSKQLKKYLQTYIQ